MFEKKERDCFRNPIRLRHQLLRSLIKKKIFFKFTDDILEVKKFIVKKMLCTESFDSASRFLFVIPTAVEESLTPRIYY